MSHLGRTLGLVAIVAALAVTNCDRSTPSDAGSTPAITFAPPAELAPTPALDLPGLTRVPAGDERDAVRKIAALIKAGGPFPYPHKDGSTFQNRERRLPLEARGYYREYTVPTPGLSHRGARRIVAGRDKDMHYTRDHYRTFVRLTR